MVYLIAPNLAAVLLIILGTAGLFFPKTIAAFVGIQPIEPEGISEIRSTLGTFFLGLGTACLWLQSTDAFVVLGIASLGAATVRLMSSFIDRSVSIKISVALSQKPYSVFCFCLVGDWVKPLHLRPKRLRRNPTKYQ